MAPRPTISATSRALVRVEVRAILIHHLASLRDRLIQQRFQTHGVALAGLERPAVSAQNRAKRDMNQVDLVIPPPPGHGEQ